MPTKQEIMKYIHNVKACNRIDVFFNPISGDYWFHFLVHNGIVAYCSDIEPKDGSLDMQVENAKKFVTCKGKVQSDAGDPAVKTLRKVQKKLYTHVCKIVRKKSKWGIVWKHDLY